MKTSLLLFTFIVSFVLTQAQTFNDCAVEFRSKWKKVQLDALTKNIDNKKRDSVYVALESIFEKCILGSELPAFNLITLDGKSIAKQDLSGKVVFMNIWTIGCGACWLDVPVLNKIDSLYNRNKDFVFISILLDEEPDLSAFLQRDKTWQSIDFDLIANDAPFGNNDLKKILTFPTHLFIDKQGKISKKLTGSFTDLQKQEEYLRTAIDELLAK